MNAIHSEKRGVAAGRQASAGSRAPKLVGVDRSIPFKPVDFLGKCWGVDEEDERALALPEIDLAAVRLETVLAPGEAPLHGEARLERLKQRGIVRLDAMVFHALWENQRLIPKHWQDERSAILFDGTILYHLQANRYVLCLYSRESRWHWNTCWLGDKLSRNDFSAVLPLN